MEYITNKLSKIIKDEHKEKQTISLDSLILNMNYSKILNNQSNVYCRKIM